MARRGPRRRRGGHTTIEGAFDPNDATNVEHVKIGVWDLYIRRERRSLLAYVPHSWLLNAEMYAGMLQDMPYFWRTMKDVGEASWHILAMYGIVMFLLALIPAMKLW